MELSKIEDFIMEDDKFESLDDWYNSTVNDLSNLAYRTTGGLLKTSLANRTNLKLTTKQEEGLKEDLRFRYELKGETKRLKEIERRMIGKYKISIVDEETKRKRFETLQEFIRYFNTNEITNTYDNSIMDEEIIGSNEVELSFEEAIRRGIIIASITSNKRLSVGTVIATLNRYPVKDVTQGMLGKELGQRKSQIKEFISFYEDKTVEDLKKLLKKEFPNFEFDTGNKEENIYDIEYFFPLGQPMPQIVYYENKTLKTEGEVPLKDLIRRFKVKSNPDLMKIFLWMMSHQPTGPEFPKTTSGTHILVITNRPSSQLRLTTGTPWANDGSCAAWGGGAGRMHPEYGGSVSRWTGWTDLKNMNLIAFLLSNASDSKQSDLEDINADWPVVYDDTLQGRMVMRWGYASEKGLAGRKLSVDSYDINKKIGFGIEPYYGKDKTRFNKILTTAVFELLNLNGLSEKYWSSLISPHLHNGATDRSKVPNASGGNLPAYGSQIFYYSQSSINGVYYVNEEVDILLEQKTIAMSNNLSITEAMSIAKRRIPVEVRLLLAQNPQVWLYPNAIKELILLKDKDTNLILLNSRFCSINNILQIFDTLDFYPIPTQIIFIQNILNSTSFNSLTEQRLINHISNNEVSFNEYFNLSPTYKKLSKELKLNYGLFLLLEAAKITDYGKDSTLGLDKKLLKTTLKYYPYSNDIIDKNIEVLNILAKKLGSLSKINRPDDLEFITLLRTLLFAKNMSGENYIKVINILKNILIKQQATLISTFPTNRNLSKFILELISVSYILNYSEMANNNIRDYNLGLSEIIFKKLKDNFPKSSKEDSLLSSSHEKIIEDFVLNNATRMQNFDNRQITNDGEATLPYIMEYIYELSEIKDLKIVEKLSMTKFGLLLSLNSNPQTLQNYSSLENIEQLLQISFSESIVDDEVRLQLLSNTIDFENENNLGEKLIRNPVERLNLFKGLTNQRKYLKIFTETIRKIIKDKTPSSDEKESFYKDELENYVLQDIMANKLYNFELYSEESISAVQLSTYLTDSEAIENLFRECIKEAFGDFYSELTYVQRNPLPIVDLVGLYADGQEDEAERLNTMIENIKLSDEWTNIDFVKFISYLNFYDPNEDVFFGFINNNNIPDNLQNFILNDLDKIALEYELMTTIQLLLPEWAVRLSLNKNISVESIEKIIVENQDNQLVIKQNLASNNNTPVKYLVSDSIDTKNSLFDLYPYEVLLNNQIQLNEFYELYNYVFDIITTKITKNSFNWSLFSQDTLQPLMGMEKSKNLREKMELILTNNENNVEYWRGGYNLAKKFSKVDEINMWIIGGGAGGIADYPIMPDVKYQTFGILKWSSDKNKIELLNIGQHKKVSDELVYILGDKISFNKEGHIQTEELSETLSPNDLFGFIPEEDRDLAPMLQYCNDCLTRTTEKGKPVKYRFENQEAIDKHIVNKHQENQTIELITEAGKQKKWTHECIFTIVDNRPISKGEVRIPDWRYKLTQEKFNNLINTLAIRIGSLELYDRIYPSLPIKCDAGQDILKFTTEDMLRKINQSYAWSVDFIDDNLDLLCNQIEQYSLNEDMWSNFIITDNFISYSLDLFKESISNKKGNSDYNNLMIYLLSLVDLNRITSTDLVFLTSNLSDVDILVLLNNFLSDVKF